MKDFIEKYKLKIIVIICLICAGLTTVSATIIIFSSEEVSYDNSKSGMSSSNVQDAIDELYGVARLSDRIDELEEELTTTKTQLNNKVDDYWKTVYPVGSIYISVNSTSPQTKFGGTWVSFGSGRTIVGVNSSDTSFNTVEKTGGGKTTSYTPAGTVGSHTLTTNEIPAHTHGSKTLTGTFTMRKWGEGSLVINRSGIVTLSETSSADSFSTGTTTTIYKSHIVTINATHEHTSVGGSKGHSHGFTGTAANISTVQPYITVYMWKRTA